MFSQKIWVKEWNKEWYAWNSLAKNHFCKRVEQKIRSQKKVELKFSFTFPLATQDWFLSRQCSSIKASVGHDWKLNAEFRQAKRKVAYFCQVVFQRVYCIMLLLLRNYLLIVPFKIVNWEQPVTDFWKKGSEVLEKKRWIVNFVLWHFRYLETIPCQLSHDLVTFFRSFSNFTGTGIQMNKTHLYESWLSVLTCECKRNKEKTSRFGHKFVEIEDCCTLRSFKSWKHLSSAIHVSKYFRIIKVNLITAVTRPWAKWVKPKNLEN